jgi:hypothetical protein
MPYMYPVNVLGIRNSGDAVGGRMEANKSIVSSMDCACVWDSSWSNLGSWTDMQLTVATEREGEADSAGSDD